MEAIKRRYSKFEDVMTMILKEEYGVEYERIEKNKLTEGSTIVMIARVASIEKDTNDLQLEFLDPLNKGQRIFGSISEEEIDSAFVFKNQMICFEGLYSDERVILKKIFRGKKFQFLLKIFSFNKNFFSKIFLSKKDHPETSPKPYPGLRPILLNPGF